MEAVAVQHVEDEERFNKIQLVDQNNFQDRLDSLQVSCASKHLSIQNYIHRSLFQESTVRPSSSPVSPLCPLVAGFHHYHIVPLLQQH